MIDRKVEIISPYDDEENYCRLINLDERHLTGFREFIKENNLTYKGYENEAGYTLALYLTSIGYLVLQAEKEETSLVFLPKSISQNQYNWYRENKKNLKRIKLAILDLNEDGMETYDAITLCGEKPFNKLRELIEEKEIIKTIKKQNNTGV